jgi:iron complex outermembrane receptor protein
MMKTRSIWMVLALALSAAPAWAQGLITGSVKGEDGSPLPSAVIKESSTGATTVADGNGQYRLQVASKTASVSATLMGYVSQTKTVQVVGNATVNFVLDESEEQLDEVVIVGYGTSNVKDLTGSLVSVKSKSFQKGAFASPTQLIVGKTPGVRITAGSGRPGEGARIRIRGGSSINASNDPLIVIDGLPSEGMGLLNPNDIESFTVLKDASATAIYGSRAANGVILITTKKGAKDTPLKVELSAVTSLRTTRNRMEVLTTEEFVDAINTFGTNAQRKRLAAAQGYYQVGGTGNVLIATDSAATVTNWQDEIYQRGMANDINVALSGGVKNLPYRLGIGYYTESGVLRTSNLERFSLTLNASPKITRNLTANLSAKAYRADNRYANQGAIGSAVWYDPTRPVYSADTSAYGGYHEWKLPTGDLSNLSPRNPVGLLNLREDIGTNDRLIANVLFDYKPFSETDLHMYLNVGGDFGQNQGTVVVPDYAAMSFVNGGENNRYYNFRTNQLLEAYANYKKDLAGGKVKTDWTGGYSFQKWRSYSENLPSLRFNGDTLSPANPFPYDVDNALMSFYGRSNVNILGKYLITATLRSDGSSRFAPESRWGLFPSVALGWNMLEEKMFSSLKGKISSMKFRASVGITGQQDIYNDYGYIANYAYGTGTAQYQFGSNFVDVLRPDAYDYFLEWEKTRTTNFGLDFGIWKNRVNASVDVYEKYTYDLLGVIPVAAGTNFSNLVLTNVGSMSNRGLEANLNIVAVDNDNASLEFGINGAINRNQITKLTRDADSTSKGIRIGGIAGGVGNTIQIHQVGHPMFSFYTYEHRYDVNGVIIERNGKLDRFDASADENGNGRIDDIEAFVDQNGDGIINSDDLVIMDAQPEPVHTLGFTTTWRYKKWSGGMTWRGEFGQYMYNNNNSLHGNFFSVGGSFPHLNNMSRDFLNTNFMFNTSEQLMSNYFIERADYVRLDNFYVAYDLGNLYKDKYPATVNFSVQNALVFTNYSGLDPELAGGIDNMIFPRPRVFNLQLNVTL